MLVAGAASAQSQPFVGQLMLFAGNFCPRGWVQADGQLMPISQNTALFSILGTTYGGDGKRTFALPKLAAPNVAGVPAGTGLSWCIALYGVYPSRS
jgi:microcystin-dependent protein